MRKLLITAASILCACFIVTQAEASRHPYRHAVSQQYRYDAWSHHFGRYMKRRHWHYAHRRHMRHYRYAAHVARSHDRGQIVPHPAGCPARLFCGCGAALEIFGRNVRDLWLVSNWYRYPRAEPAPGRAVIFGTHHVAVIRQYYGDGTALLYDANSGGGLTRVHRVRIAGLAVVDPGVRRHRRPLYSYAGAVPL